ncbi:aminoacyl-tRNA deacylase [Pandoraea captiosa]|uniref:Aminoacyl-tRNA deacylase n=2 Tax=Pandoraea captiosa TaxID=2508302 RepID=A0A5E4ZZ78_9BURK|nr:aminoacyl-tRNA deacylase [Pandoraea captiosa]
MRDEAIAYNPYITEFDGRPIGRRSRFVFTAPDAALYGFPVGSVPLLTAFCVFYDMKSKATAETPATKQLREAKVAFRNHFYEYQEHGGTRVSSEALQVPEHEVIKTLVMEDEDGNPLIVLMHGDRQVSTKSLARQAGRKRIEPCKPEVANRHSGFLVGGTSPFGTRKRMPIYMEASILELPEIYINGGRRGYLVSMAPAEIVRVLAPTLVNVALAD